MKNKRHKDNPFCFLNRTIRLQSIYKYTLYIYYIYIVNVLKKCYSEGNQNVFDHTFHFIYNLLPFWLVFSISCINETAMNANEIILKVHLFIHHRDCFFQCDKSWSTLSLVSYCKQIAIYGILILHVCTWFVNHINITGHFQAILWL